MDAQTTANTPETANEIQKRSPLKVIAIGIAVLLAGAAFLRLCMPKIYYRLYPGNRINGEVTVTIDGQPAQIAEDSIYSAYKSRVTVTGNGFQLSTKGNKYGPYHYSFSVEELPDTKFTFYSYQFNWWNVTDFTLQYNIDTEANLVEYHAEHVELLESGRKSDLIVYSGSYSLDEQGAEVCVCSP